MSAWNLASAALGLGTEILRQIPDPDPGVTLERVRARTVKLSLRERRRLLEGLRRASEALATAKREGRRARLAARAQVYREALQMTLDEGQDEPESVPPAPRAS